ncbi:MAG TPA: LptA/OstA family protein, partial [Edaphobacter sp.]|nr:LptA/OstA family protein [Edaphobacter sp.]
NVSIERLRFWLLAGAGLLVIVIVAFLGYAHYRAHRFLRDLPQKLGVDIRSETNNWTYSQSAEGRTIYTIHAAKAVERSNGKITLHDVGIVLYGRKQDRADRIYGQEFEYDQKNEIIRAVGEVHIDLQAPEAADAKTKMDYAAGKDLHGGQTGGGVAGAHESGEHESGDGRLIHVTTSGLVFLRKLGVAATDKDIEFASGGMTGHAVGADYSADTGVVVLHAAVKVNGLQHDRPVVLTASHAVLDRPGQTVVLSQARYVAVGGGSGGDKGSAEGQTAEAQNVVVHLRTDGSAERLEADGDVTLTGAAGESVRAPRGEMTLNAQNQPQSAVMSGGVKYTQEEPLRQARGEAGEGRAGFDKKGHPEHVVMTGGVHLQERVRASDGPGEPWSDRELNGGTVELALAADAAGKAQLRDAKAAGDARLTVVSPAAKGGGNGGLKGGTTRSALAGDVLTAHFVRVGNRNHLAEVHGDGHTALRRVSATGVVNTGSGDSLVAHFRPVTARAGRGPDRTGAGSTSGKQERNDGLAGGGADEVSDAVEQGHVVMTQVPVRRPGEASPPPEERATAEKAVFDGELERTILTGNVQVSNGTSVLWADRVTMEQQTGDAAADGGVKASYRQAGSTEEPAHVLAARAELKHDSQIATFHGIAGTPARLWQGASQVEAPVLQFDQKQRRLLAYGEGQGAPMAVHTVLVSGGSSGSPAKLAPAKPKAGSGKLIAGGKGDVVQVASRELVYLDEARKAEFTGGVQVQSRDGSLRGQEAVVYLQPAGTGAGKGSSPSNGKVDGGKTGTASAVGGSGFMAGSVERMVVSGPLDMQQPGRRATGEQLVYTASDGLFVLTGTPAVLPKVTDDQRGTVTGTSLRFHSGDDNVVVSNGGENGAGQRVRTETRVKNKQ